MATFSDGISRPVRVFPKTFRIVSFFLVISLLNPCVALPQGLTVPAGSRVNVNSGTVKVGGDVTVGGTLQTTTGTVALTGDWTNTGAYEMGTGTVDFYHPSATQQLNSNGVAVGQRFYNLTHSAAGTVRLDTNQVNIDGDFSNAAGTFNANGLNMTVAGDWSNDATFTPGSTSQTVTLDGIGQTIYGSTAFRNFTKTVAAADTLTFEHTVEQSITGTLTMQGAAGQLLSINSTDDDASPTQFNISLEVGGVQQLSYLNVKNSVASGLTLVAGTTSVNSGNNVNWVFGGADLVWQGDVDDDWSVAGNWNLGFVPASIDSVTIPNVTGAGGVQPVLTANVTVSNITVTTAGSLNAAGFDLTVTDTLTIESGATVSLGGTGTMDLNLGTLDNSGILELTGNEALVIATIDPDGDPNSGTFKFVGDNDVSENFIIPDWGGVDYFNLVVYDSAGASADTFRTNSALDIAGTLMVTAGTFDLSTNANQLDIDGTLTVNGGTVTATNGTINANNDVVISAAGILTAPSGNFSIAGDFSRAAGTTFTHSSGTVILDGGDQTISGGATFAILQKVLTATDATLTIEEGAANTVTVTNSLTLTGAELGADDAILTVRSGDTGSDAWLVLSDGGVQALSYLNVIDMNATGGEWLVARNSDPGTRTTHWYFGSITLTWDGSAGTNWVTPANWDMGLAPIAGDSVIIPNAAATDPHLTAATTVDDLTIESARTLYLDGRSFTVTGGFDNAGTVELWGTEPAVSIASPDINSGTFIYRGNNDGNGDALTLFEISSSVVDYYNLTIASTDADDSFTTSAALAVGGALTVSSGELILYSHATNGLTTTGTLTVSGGTLTATNGNIDATSVLISSGVFTAPGAGRTFTVADDFSYMGGTFTHSSGEIVFDTTAIATITGDATFYDFTSIIPGKILEFAGLSTQTIENDWSVQGSASSDLVLRSTNASSWNIGFTQADQTSQYVDLSRSEVVGGNDAVCFSCTNSGNNDLLGAPEWQFRTLAISVPLEGKTVDTTPTIIGVADPGDVVTLHARRGAPPVDTVVATVTADANGNFRVEIDGALALNTGSNYITPYLGALEGGVVNITVADPTTYSQVPTITSHSDGDRVSGPRPTITGQGLAGQAVTILAADANANMLLQTVGTGTVNGSGNYSITLTTDLYKGTNYLSVSVDDVASDIVELALTDPFGVVFDSISNTPISGARVYLYRAGTTPPALAVPGADLDASDSNPVTTGEDGFYSFLAANGNYYFVIEADDYEYPSAETSFPGGRHIITGSQGQDFTVAGVVLEMDHPMDNLATVLRVEKDANKAEVRIGDVVTYTVTIESQSSSHTISDVYLEDKIPPGFKYVDGRVTLDGVPVADPTGNRPLMFSLGNFTPGAEKTLKYQLVVGSGVTTGTYANVAFARYLSGNRLSNRASESVKVVLDPLFDLGTTIGKVFFDYNENGVQDAPEYSFMEGMELTEKGVPNIRIVMEDGTVITTDSNGLFHVPALTPGRHLFRLDERTLPEGGYVTTDKVVLVDVTPGLMTKVNFGVAINEEMLKSEDHQYFTSTVTVTQEQGKPQARLHVSLFEEEVAVFNDVVVSPVEFGIFMNYAPFIARWRLDILDKETKRAVKSFSGDRLTINDPIFWDGKDAAGEYVPFDRRYTFVVSVEDLTGRYDDTAPQDVVFKRFEKQEDVDAYREARDSSRVRDHVQWVHEQRAKSTLAVQNILLSGETVTIRPVNAAALQSVQVIKDGTLIADLPIVSRQGLTAREVMEGQAAVPAETGAISVILPNGDYQIVVQEDTVAAVSALIPEQERSVERVSAVRQDLGVPVKAYTKNVKIGEDYVFFVGIGDATAGYTFNKGDIEPVAQEDKYNQGFWSDGKMAYYLQGKIRGKYLITSSFDSDRDKKSVLRTVDETKYYPVYGDASVRDYKATDTQGPLYLMLEWDRSSAIWGNYAVGFEDTEFAKFNRTLYGGKVDYQTVSTTKYGDPRTKVVAFRARAQQQSAHNEFLATGGSLYYLKHKDLVEGSDQIRIEVRDKITGLPKTTREMKEGADYQIDYESGRIIFWKPVPILLQSYSIISDGLLNGDLVYVMVDYEYQIKDLMDEANVGARIKQALTDAVVVGGTYVKESQTAADYELTGTDVTAHLGKDATVVAEYAETKSEVQGNFVSTDGGLSFDELATAAGARGRAYGIKGDAVLFNRLAVKPYYKWIENDFSTSDTTAQQGKELMGIEAIYDIAPTTRLTARHDIQTLIDDGNLQTQMQVGAYRTTTTLMQVVHQMNRLKLTTEYKRTGVTNRDAQFESQTNTASEIIAVQADYAATDKVTLTVAQQHALRGPAADQTMVGVTVTPTDKILIKAAQTMGEKGMLTNVDAAIDMSERLTVTGAYAIGTDTTGESPKDVAAGTVGATAKLTDTTSVTTAIGVSDIRGDGQTTTVTVGGSSALDEKTKIDTAVALSTSSTGQAQTVSLGGTAQVDEKTQTESKVSLTDSTADGKTTAYTFGTTRQINEGLQLATTQTVGTSKAQQTTENTYALVRNVDGRKLEGSLSRKYAHGSEGVSQSNIFGLSGDVNDRWAVSGTFERGEIQNLDGTTTDRNAMTAGIGYAKKDETGTVLTSSTKIEARFDTGASDSRQLLVYNTTEGKLTRELTVSLKGEASLTQNVDTDTTDAQHKEFSFGAGYRPLMHDRLNILGKYTYQEEQAPAGQTDSADVDQERAHVASIDAIYDLDEHWQLAEKFAYRIMEEKVEGFPFTKTHTWLMIQRLNYKIDADWVVGGEFRILRQEEAQDAKRGVLLEVARRLGQYAQLGVGYNFTDFNDDLTALSYTSQGPFIRMTGKFYDQTPEELARERAKWLDAKVERWAWAMVEDELSKAQSPIIGELNVFFGMAEQARKKGNWEESYKIYRDIIMAGQMMFEEAASYINAKIEHEESLLEMKALADQYFKNGQYEKARKILEKIMEEAQSRMLR